MNRPIGIDKDDILDDPIFELFDQAIEYMKKTFSSTLANQSQESLHYNNLSHNQQTQVDIGLSTILPKHIYDTYLLSGLVLSFELNNNFVDKDSYGKKDVKTVFYPLLAGLYGAKTLVYLFMSQKPLTLENFKHFYIQFSGIDSKFVESYFAQIWSLYDIFFNTRNSKNILYLNNLGRESNLNFNDTSLKVLDKRQENIEGKYVDVLKNFITNQAVDKTKFYQRENENQNEYIYPILLGKDITKLLKVDEESVGYNDEIVHGGMFLRKNFEFDNSEKAFLPSFSTLPKLLTHHSYLRKVYGELFFNPFIFGNEHPKGGNFGQKKLKEVLEGVQKHIKNTSSAQTYSDIISYLQLREEKVGQEIMEKRAIVIIIPQKYISMDRKKLLGFKILPKSRAPDFELSKEQEADYEKLIDALVISQNQSLVPCNYLCLVYDAQTQRLISSYPLDEKSVSQRRFFINVNQIKNIGESEK